MSSLVPYQGIAFNIAFKFRHTNKRLPFRTAKGYIFSMMIVIKGFSADVISFDGVS